VIVLQISKQQPQHGQVQVFHGTGNKFLTLKEPHLKYFAKFLTASRLAGPLPMAAGRVSLSPSQHTLRPCSYVWNNSDTWMLGVNL
jgi:hypothetical protein